MKYILILFSVFLLASCGRNPKKEEAVYEEDYCQWIIAEKDYDIPFDDDELNKYFLLEKEKERKKVFVLDNFYKKYEVGDTICNKQ